MENRNWLRVNLESLRPDCNRFGIGSRVKLFLGVKILTQEFSTPTGFQGQNAYALHFGLGQHEGPIKIEVDWCLKEKRQYEVVNINKEVKFTFKD